MHHLALEQTNLDIYTTTTPAYIGENVLNSIKDEDSVRFSEYGQDEINLSLPQ